MEKYQIGIIIALLCISVAVLVVPAVVFCVRRMLRKPSCGPHKKSGISRMLVFSACLLGAVWCLRYSVGYFFIIFFETDTVALTWWEEIFNSMVHTLKTFSIDEGYTEYMINGKLMLREIFGENTVWQTVYGLYVSVLNFVTPVAGGAIIFEILAGIFPKIKLLISYFAFWKEKYYFSKLNAASLALAKSVCSIRTCYFKKPVIIFADAYFADGDEKSSEMLLEAKSLGAICIRDDLSYVRKNKFGMRKFFLIDETESVNLQALAEFANLNNSRYLKKSEIYFFINDDAYIEVERNVRDKLLSDLNFTNEELPIFIPVKSYRNLISNLLADIPLYEPLIGKKRNSDGTQDLTVTILGTGDIGTEMFLSTYWFGQILDCNLKINVISKDSQEEFRSKIDYVNPEIMHTTIEGDPILQINRRGDTAKIYCDVKYYQCDVKSSDFITYLTEQEKHIIDTDYFFVALGTDEENISVANTIKKYVGQYHIKINSPIRTIITYVVYNSELAKTLNRRKYFNFVNDSIDVYMQATGSLNDVYSIRNVFMSEHKPFAQQIDDIYAESKEREKRAEKHRVRIEEDAYKYWANLARSMHIKYKVYSFGLINASLFDYPDSVDSYYNEIKKAHNEYEKVFSAQVEYDNPDREKEFKILLHKMAWLEHRRWSAFTRVLGFRGTKDYDVYAVSGEMGSYKQMDIKLHPCLVECDQNGIRADIKSNGTIDKNTLLRCSDYTDFDLLDELSYDLYNKKYNDCDFKQHDYPIAKE